MEPAKIILPTEVIVKKYRSSLIRMIDCNYDLEDHLNEAMEIIRQSKNSNVTDYLTNLTIEHKHFTHENDRDVFAQAFRMLVMDMLEVCVRCGLFYNDTIPHVFGGMVGDNVITMRLGGTSESHYGT